MKLNNALEQHKDDESTKVVLEERQQFEEELRSYSGEDPLDPWYRYIQVCSFVDNELSLLKSRLLHLSYSGWSRRTLKGARRVRCM